VKALRRLATRLAALRPTRAQRLDADLDDEIGAHLEIAEQELRRRGLSPDEARTEARRRFGGVQQIREEHRRQRSAELVETMVRDVRLACRLLWRQPAWTIAAILCLAIATGANTAAFSIVNAVLLRPLPFPDAGQLSMVALRERDSGQTRPLSLTEYRALADGAAGRLDLAAYSFLPVSLGSEAGTDMAEGQLVSGNYFQVLRVSPAVGRFFDAGADRYGAPPELVISDRLWRSRFAADPAVVGRTVRVSGRPMVISAVAPPGFLGAMGLIAPDLWLPAQHLTMLSGNSAADKEPLFGAVARRPTGASHEQANLVLDAALAAIGDRAEPRAGRTSVVEPASGFGVPPAIRQQMPAALIVIFTLAGLVVVVAAANVASLVLARGTRRVNEMGVRLALGASRARVARQLLTESLVLSIAGSGVGLVLAFLATRLLQPTQTNFDYVSYAVEVTPDLRVFAYALAGAVVIALVFGVAPAFAAAGTNLVGVLRPTGGAGRSPRIARMFNALVMGQIAVCTVLLVAAGLLGRSYVNARSVDTGFDIENVVGVSLNFSQLGPIDDAATRRIVGSLLDRIKGIVGVERISLVVQSPVSSVGPTRQIWDAEGTYSADLRPVSVEYFDLLDLPILEGSVFSGDRGDESEVVVNAAMADALRGQRQIVGQRIHFDASRITSAVVVGVVQDRRTRGGEPQPTIYQSLERRVSDRLTFLVRSSLAPEAVSTAIRAVVADVRADLPVLHIRTLRDERQRVLAPRRQAASLVGAVGGTGLLLTAIGLYGVTSFGIRSRLREFGIRIALGATAGHLRQEVLYRGLRTVAWGLAVGLLCSLLAARFLSRVLLGVGASDWLTFSGVTVALTAVAAAALLLSLRVVRSVEPTVALRQD
jgi:predicted permease